MRTPIVNVSMINWLLTTSIVLSAILLLPTASANVYNNVSILNIETLTDATHSHRLRILLDNREETLLLNRSDAFNSLDIITVTGKNTRPIDTNDDVRNFSIFQGQIENVADSWVRLVINGDEVAGIIDTGNDRIHLNHLVSTDVIRQIRSSFTQPIDRTVRAPADPINALQSTDVSSNIVEIDIGNGFFDNPDKVTKVANIAIVIDSAYDEAIGGRGLAQAIATINAVDGIYREEFGLALNVETAIMVTDSDTLALSGISLQENLSRFRDYRMTADQLTDDLALVHLFTGVFTADPSVGLAYIDTVCRTNGYDVSLSLPFRYPILLTAHEIGHNLGALHDDETNQCSAVTDTLMFSHIDDNSTRAFSSCSVDAISKRIEESTCHTDAIDMDITLARQDDTGIIALVTNTDTLRAFPAATLSLEMENASVATLPASCEIVSEQTVQCTVNRTFAQESQSLAFDFHFEQNEEVTIQATLAANGFFDVHNANNTAEIVIPQIIVTTQDDTDNFNDSPAIADASDGDVSGGGSGIPSSGGGGSLGLITLFAGLFGFYIVICRALRTTALRQLRYNAPIQQQQV